MVVTKRRLQHQEEEPEQEKHRKLKAAQELENCRNIEEEYMKKYSYDGVIQCPELANKLQYLIGRKFIDPENDGLYEVYSVFYNSEFEVVVGRRRSLDGRSLDG